MNGDATLTPWLNSIIIIIIAEVTTRWGDGKIKLKKIKSFVQWKLETKVEFYEDTRR